MHLRTILAEIAICSSLAICQTSQISKTWEPGRSLTSKLDPYVRDVEHRHQRVDPYLGNYLQRLEDRMAAAAGVKPDEIRVTSGEQWYGFRLPEGVLYLSEGLLVRVSSESELAGLLAHELAHANQKFQQCALATGYLPVDRSPRPSERLATQQAIAYMKASGFDPSAMLDLFSQISYEDHRLTKAIAGEDLLSMRVALEAEPEPAAGYAIDGSAFAKFHASLSGSTPAIVIRPRQ